MDNPGQNPLMMQLMMLFAFYGTVLGLTIYLSYCKEIKPVSQKFQNPKNRKPVKNKSWSYKYRRYQVHSVEVKRKRSLILDTKRVRKHSTGNLNKSASVIQKQWRKYTDFFYGDWYDTVSNLLSFTYGSYDDCSYCGKETNCIKINHSGSRIICRECNGGRTIYWRMIFSRKTYCRSCELFYDNDHVSDSTVFKTLDELPHPIVEEDLVSLFQNIITHRFELKFNLEFKDEFYKRCQAIKCDSNWTSDLDVLYEDLKRSLI